MDMDMRGISRCEVDPPAPASPPCASPELTHNTPRPHPPGLTPLPPRPSKRPMSSFDPKPWPPPALKEVPLEYIHHQQRRAASIYWNRPETADCTIIIPVPHPRSERIGRSMRSPEAAPLTSSAIPSPSTLYDSHNLGRRATEPSLHTSPRIILKLHTDYLSSHSSFLRNLFSGASPIDLITRTVGPAPTLLSGSAARRPSGPFHVPPNRQPRLLPSGREHPIVFLPVPDPSSMHLLVHWMYWGSPAYIEDALARGSAHWEGLARNAEYLGMDREIKMFLGTWYVKWLCPARRRRPGAPPPKKASDEDEEMAPSSNSNSNSETDEDSDSDGESVYEDALEYGEDELSNTSVSSASDEDLRQVRGRKRTSRRIARRISAGTALTIAKNLGFPRD